MYDHVAFTIQAQAQTSMHHWIIKKIRILTNGAETENEVRMIKKWRNILKCIQDY